ATSRCPAVRSCLAVRGSSDIEAILLFMSWHNEPQSAWNNLKHRGLISNQLSVDIEPHARPRLYRDPRGAAEQDRLRPEMIAEDDLRHQQHHFRGRTFWDQDHVEQTVTWIGFRSDRQTSRHIGAVCHDHII